MFSVQPLRKSKSPTRSLSPAKNGLMSSTKSASVIKTATSPRLFDLPKIPSYYRVVSFHDKKDNKNSMIKSKLDFDRKIRLTVDRRVKDENMFVRYKDNPFVVRDESLTPIEQEIYKAQDQILPHDYQFYEKGKKEMRHSNIVESINRFRADNQIVRAKQLPRLTKEKTQLSQTLLFNLKHDKKLTPTNVVQIQGRESVLPEMDLDEIVGLQQESFYVKNQKEINIFSIIFHKPNFMNSSILDKNYFNFFSIIDKMSKCRVYFKEQLSTKARSLAKNNHLKNVDLTQALDVDIKLDFTDLRFEDLIKVASGRCTPEKMNFVMKRDISDDDDLQEFSPQTYKENTRTKQNNCEQNNEQMKEIRKYLMLPMGKDDNGFINQFKQVKETILSHVKKKREYLKVNVQDKKSNRKLTADIKRDIESFIGIDIKKQRFKDQQGNRTFSKSRAQTLKTGELLQTLQKIRGEEKVFNKFQRSVKNPTKLI